MASPVSYSHLCSRATRGVTKGGDARPDPSQHRTERFTEVAMLVLSRKLNEKIVINGNIVVTIVKIDRNQVRIGIEAPGEVPVYREEILPASLTRQDEAELLVQA